MNIEKTFCYTHKIEKFKNINNKNICRLCRNEASAAYKERNKEIIRKKNQEYSKRTRGRAKAWLDEDRKKHPERYKNYAAKYYDEVKEIQITKKIIRAYGLSVPEYDQMIIDCDNKCHICRKSETYLFAGKIRRLCLDHDHKTGKLRGLLCFACNMALGKFGDDQMRLQSAIDYLKKHE